MWKVQPSLPHLIASWVSAGSCLVIRWNEHDALKARIPSLFSNHRLRRKRALYGMVVIPFVVIEGLNQDTVSNLSPSSQVEQVRMAILSPCLNSFLINCSWSLNTCWLRHRMWQLCLRSCWFLDSKNHLIVISRGNRFSFECGKWFVSLSFVPLV